MTSKLTASPEVVQTCREVVQTMTTDLNQTYVSGLTEGLKIGVMFLVITLIVFASFSLGNLYADIRERRTQRLEKLQESSEVQS